MLRAAATYLPVVLPLAAACAAFVLRGRWGARLGVATGVGLVLATGALAHEVWTAGPWRYPVGGWRAPLGVDLVVDAPSIVFLALVAIVGLGVSLHARGYFAHAEDERDAFWPLWLALWAGLGALALSADIFTLYVTFELIGLAAVALVALGKTAEAAPAAERYLLASMLGALAYLLAVALLYAEYGVLDLELLARAARPTPSTAAAVALAIGALAVKAALWPVHGWLPPAHAAAPAPASAILSSLVVKAAFFAMLKLLGTAFLHVRPPALDAALAMLGAAAVIGGSLLALRQARLKRVIAYSTVAQLGYLVVPFAFGPLEPAVLWAVLAFAAAHGLAKAALFLAAGNIQRAFGHDRLRDLGGAAAALPVSFFAIALAAVSLIGLPPSGGFLAKWALLQVAIARGHWGIVVLLLLGGLLAAAYLLRVFERPLQEANAPAMGDRPSAVMEGSALALALLAVLLGLAPVPDGGAAFGRLPP